jgi:two-component system, OmpR family, sensor kinase
MSSSPLVSLTMTTTMMVVGSAMVAETESSAGQVPVHRRFTVSVRVRILAWVLVVVALAMAVSGVATYTVLIARLDEQIDERLSQEVTEFRTLADRGIDPDTRLSLSRSSVDRLFRVALERHAPARDEAVFGVVSGGGVLRTSATARARIYDDPVFLARLASVTAPTYGDISTGGGPVRYVAYPVRSADQIAGVYVVAVFRDVERRQVSDIMTTFASVAAAALVVIALVGWLVAGRLLAPVRLLRQTTQQITDTDLTRRIPVHGRDDVSELARTFNAMLDRLEESFATQRQLLDDVGHELRTPITIIRGHLELMSLSNDADEHAETTALVLDELDRMSRLVDDLITLAKAERPDFLRVGSVELRTLVEDVYEKAHTIAPRCWQLDANADGVVDADRQRLTQALVQLADNAAKHTTEGDRIVIGSTARDGVVCLSVTDTGPGVDSADAERIFDRFTRKEDSDRPTESAGLGLAIVRAIAAAHDGRVTLDSRPGDGATFTLEIPTREEAAR